MKPNILVEINWRSAGSGLVFQKQDPASKHIRIPPCKTIKVYKTKQAALDVEVSQIAGPMMRPRSVSGTNKHKRSDLPLECLKDPKRLKKAEEQNIAEY